MRQNKIRHSFVTTGKPKGIPDEVAFVEAIPKTSVGKFAKRFLRGRFKEKRFA